jgi:chromosome partitioning protein
MRVIAIGNSKGGVGKSAVAINLAVLASRDAKAALVDLDEGQLSSVEWAKERDGDKPHVRQAGPADLADALDELHKQKYRWAFLDMPGRADVAVSAGLKEADFLLVPVRPYDVDISASYEIVRRAERAKLPYAFLINMLPPQRERGEEAAVALKGAGYVVCPVMIGQRLNVADALGEGRGICEGSPRNASCLEFTALFDWLRRKTK